MQKQNQSIIALSFLLGFTSMIGQILLLRELITVFYGNETAYSIVLASWLFWVAMGSFTITLLSKKVRTFSLLISFLCAIYFILPLSIVAIRSIKEIMHFSVGEIVGILPICLASFILLAPLSILLGSIFTLICRFSEENEKSTVAGVGTIYLWESVGAVLGGLTFSFILIHIMSAMSIAFLIAMMNIAAILFLSKLQDDAPSTARPAASRRKPRAGEVGGFVKFAAPTLANARPALRPPKGRRSKLRIVVIVILLCSFLFYPTGLIEKLDQFTRKIQWKGFEIICVVDSIYGNITLTKKENEYSLFERGLLSYSTKDEMTNEENTHYALLEHSNPKNVLLIGNGVGGSLREILKHSITQLDYVELDPMVIQISQRYLPKEILSPLKDKRLRVIYTDARFFVKRTKQKYDVIIINLPDPTSALINRYYSLEFFKEANLILNPNGILALTVSSSENYLSQEAQTFLRSINSTLKKVFPDVKSLPGDTNIFLASKNKNHLTYEANILIDRLKTRNIQTKFVREYYVPFKLSKDRISYIEKILKDDGTLNTDMHPIAYFYDIVLWSTHFNTLSKELLESITWIKFKHLMILPLILFIGSWFLKRKNSSTTLIISIMNTGLSQIIFQLVVILAFQTFYGYAYYKIGLIMTSFMGGLALGSLLARKIIIEKSTSQDTLIYKIYISSQFGISLYPIFLLVVFSLFENIGNLIPIGILASVFTALPIFAGFIGGLQYPLATHLLYSMNKNKRNDITGFAGGLYAADTFGSTVGALVTGVILIPLLGIPALALFCALMNGAILILLLTSYPRS